MSSSHRQAKKRKLSAKKWLKAAILGVIATKIAYFIPVLQIVAPLVGGSVAAYVLDNGAIDGMKGGFLKGILMALPAIILGTMLSGVLAGVPGLGPLLSGSLMIIVGAIVLHSVTLGMVSGFITGAVATTAKKAEPTKTTARATAKAANKAEGKVDEAKDAYEETRNTEDTDNTRDQAEQTAVAASGGTTTSSRTATGNQQEINSGAGKRANQSESKRQENQEKLVDCTNCGSSISPQANFCGECGTEVTSADTSRQQPPKEERRTDQSKSDESSAQGATVADSTPHEQVATETTTDQNQIEAGNNSDHQQREQTKESNQDTTVSKNMANDSEPNQQPPVADAAENITEQTEFDSTAAQQLCEILSDPEANQSQIESALSDAVGIIESATAAKEAVSTVNNPGNTHELESAKRRLTQINGELAAEITPIVDQTLTLERDVDEQTAQYDQLQNATGAICRKAEKDSEIAFQTNDIAERAQTLADELRAGKLEFTDPQQSISATVDNMRQSLRPRTDQSQMLVDTLADPDKRELQRVLDTAVKTIDEHTRMHEMLAEIGTEDVKRRIDSLDRELTSQDSPVYSHLADRVRELEARIDDAESIDEIQLYAIYQEVSYYDRTLLPRLSRSQNTGGSADTNEMLTTVERRIEEINDDFVSVRPDHNHTIPKHFIGLANELANRARQEQRKNPEQAAGVLLAADTVLDYVEQLYTQNEYSVMLRRLRG